MLNDNFLFNGYEIRYLYVWYGMCTRYLCMCNVPYVLSSKCVSMAAIRDTIGVWVSLFSAGFKERGVISKGGIGHQKTIVILCIYLFVFNLLNRFDQYYYSNITVCNFSFVVTVLSFPKNEGPGQGFRMDNLFLVT